MVEVKGFGKYKTLFLKFFFNAIFVSFILEFESPFESYFPLLASPDFI